VEVVENGLTGRMELGNDAPHVEAGLAAVAAPQHDPRREVDELVEQEREVVGEHGGKLVEADGALATLERQLTLVDDDPGEILRILIFPETDGNLVIDDAVHLAVDDRSVDENAVVEVVQVHDGSLLF